MIDHLVYATPSLEEGVARIRRRLKVEPVPGGRHARWGTRNSLVGLGEEVYLEIVGPDPDGPGPTETSLFGIDTLDGPRLASWAVRVDDLERTVAAVAAAGPELGEILPGSRERPDGTVLSWRSTDPEAGREGGLYPFLIDWGESSHPAAGLRHGCELVELRVRHPEADRFRRLLGPLGVDVAVGPGDAPELVALVRTPSGVVELR